MAIASSICVYTNGNQVIESFKDGVLQESQTVTQNTTSTAQDSYRIEDMVLEEGMCFGNNVDLHDSRWKPDVGCMLSDFMVVRPQQAECLIGTPLELAQIG